MPVNQDRYETYYAEKLWQLLPSIYRAEDSDSFDRNGPLREIVNRIGAQAAILRRSIDRLWDDQSIETCDDWVIPYIGDLLATNLVASLDPRGQRIDVAKTIYYRRRKGTVAILEEIATDITGWDARVVEFFRRLGRTRHGFDPEIGLPSETPDPEDALKLQIAEGLIGKLTRSEIGGWADLRNVYGATKASSAFDEFFHTADFRRGRGMVGWHNIPRLGVFLWRLRSFALGQSDPVEVQGCPGHYTFDPTGRDVPLFAAGSRPFGDQWISPEEWQLPTPISRTLLNLALANPDSDPLYAAIDPTDGVSVLLNSLGVFRQPGTFYNLVPANQLVFDLEIADPQRGRFKTLSPPANDRVFVTYHYGFSSTIGAGSYDRRVVKSDSTPEPGARQDVAGGGNSLAAPLNAVAPQGTVSINDFLTYNAVTNVTGIDQVTLMTENANRPVIRIAPTAAWVFAGNNGSTLYLDGLFLSGAEVVLRGRFDRVVINCCSLDPGQSDSTGELGRIFALAADGRALVPSTLWVEAEVRELEVNRSLTGPIRTRAGGDIELLTVNDSIVQAIRVSSSTLFTAATLQNLKALAIRLRDGSDPVNVFVRTKLGAATKSSLSSLSNDNDPSPALTQKIILDLNALIQGPSIFDPNRFGQVTLDAAIRRLASLNPAGADLVRLNRMLLKAAYPIELLEKDDLAFSMDSGLAQLTRSTILGPAGVHRLHASECILDDVFFVEDSQDGCVRFTAWSTGSILPRKYESAQIPPGAQLFTSREFGQPGYGQLVLGVDTMIIAGAKWDTISAGAENGSEMGAFAREMNAIKDRSLRIKYQEFMPIGLVPVVVYVT
jgi:hypothetical protein